MKGFYITIFGIMLCISIIRFSYGVEPLTVSQFMIVIEDFPLDIREDFEGVVYELGRVRVSIEAFVEAFNSISSGTGLRAILSALVGVFKILWSVCLLLVAFVKFLFLVVRDLSILLVRLFSLLFGFDPAAFEESVGNIDFGSSFSGSGVGVMDSAVAGDVSVSRWDVFRTQLPYWLQQLLGIFD